MILVAALAIALTAAALCHVLFDVLAVPPRWR